MGIKNAVGMLASAVAGCAVGCAVGMGYEFVKEEKRMDKLEEKEKKFESFYRLLVAWVEMKQEGKNLAEFFEYNNIKTIAVYGMKELGERLVRELDGTEIEIKYVIDQNVDSIETNIMKMTPEDELPEVDAIVVTAIYFYQDIEEKLSKKVDYQIISLEDAVYGMI